MSFKLGTVSLSRLKTVHPNLQAVVKRAIQISEIDFSVVQGGRTLDEQRKLYGKGRNAAQCVLVGVPAIYARPGEAKVTWVVPEKGNHVIKSDGFGRAVDLAPFINGRIEWDDSGKLGAWPKIASAMKRAARELGVKITWGGDWVKTPDRPHFELG